MTGPRRAPSWSLPALLVSLVALAVSGCAALPTSGPVQVASGAEPTESAAPFDYNPPGPKPGATPAQIAVGFLNALQATPVSTKVAAQYLTQPAATAWKPGKRTVVYTTQQMLGGEPTVVVRLSGAHELDASGRWEGRAGTGGSGPAGGQLELDLRMVQEDGQWRLANPPDAMVIPQTHFVSRYRQYSLYFFDRTGTVLVPEPVYLPWGVQAPTALVTGLLAGPSGPGRRVERTFVPRGTRLAVSVPVSDTGLAEVPLTGPILSAGEADLDLALAQLSWTLRQVPEVQRIQLTVDGTPVDLPSGGTTTEVSGWTSYSPAVAAASTDLFGIRDHDVRQVVGDSELLAATLPASGTGRVRSVRSLAVSMTGQRFAVVDETGARVVSAPRDASGARSAASQAGTVYLGTDLLRPMWDLRSRLWLVDRTAAGARVVVLKGTQQTVLDVPGLTGRAVAAAALSRDGTRLAAVLEPRTAGGTQRLVVARVVRSADGTPVRLTRAVPVSTGAPWTRVRALGWRDPVTVAALSRADAHTSQVLLASVDGSSALPALTPAVDLLFQGGVGLATSPGGPVALMVATPTGRLHALDEQGRWSYDVVEPGLRVPTFVG